MNLGIKACMMLPACIGKRFNEIKMKFDFK
jgi:hypothetical protein